MHFFQNVAQLVYRYRTRGEGQITLSPAIKFTFLAEKITHRWENLQTENLYKLKFMHFEPKKLKKISSLMKIFHL